MSLEADFIARLGLDSMAAKIGNLEKRLMALESGHDKPPMYCEVKRTANEAISNSTHTYLTWQSEIYDPYNMWSSGQWVTVPVAGIYLITICVAWTTGTGYRYLGVRNNTTSLFIATQSINANSSVEYQSIAKVAKLDANTQLGAWVFHNAGVSIDVGYASNYSPIMGVYRLS